MGKYLKLSFTALQGGTKTPSLQRPKLFLCNPKTVIEELKKKIKKKKSITAMQKS